MRWEGEISLIIERQSSSSESFLDFQVSRSDGKCLYLVPEGYLRFGSKMQRFFKPQSREKRID